MNVILEFIRLFEIKYDINCDQKHSLPLTKANLIRLFSNNLVSKGSDFSFNKEFIPYFSKHKHELSEFSDFITGKTDYPPEFIDFNEEKSYLEQVTFFIIFMSFFSFNVQNNDLVFDTLEASDFLEQLDDDFVSSHAEFIVNSGHISSLTPSSKIDYERLLISLGCFCYTTMDHFEATSALTSLIDYHIDGSKGFVLVNGVGASCDAFLKLWLIYSVEIYATDLSALKPLGDIVKSTAELITDSVKNSPASTRIIAEDSVNTLLFYFDCINVLSCVRLQRDLTEKKKLFSIFYKKYIDSSYSTYVYYISLCLNQNKPDLIPFEYQSSVLSDIEHLLDEKPYISLHILFADMYLLCGGKIPQSKLNLTMDVLQDYVSLCVGNNIREEQFNNGFAPECNLIKSLFCLYSFYKNINQDLSERFLYSHLCLSIDDQIILEVEDFVFKQKKPNFRLLFCLYFYAVYKNSDRDNGATTYDVINNIYTSDPANNSFKSIREHIEKNGFLSADLDFEINKSHFRFSAIDLNFNEDDIPDVTQIYDDFENTYLTLDGKHCSLLWICEDTSFHSTYMLGYLRYYGYGCTKDEVVGKDLMSFAVNCGYKPSPLFEHFDSQTLRKVQ